MDTERPKDIVVPVQWRDTFGNEITSTNQVPHPFLIVDVANEPLTANTKWIRTLALIDTGCTQGRLDRQTIEELNPSAVGSSEFIGNTGRETVSSYLINWRPANAPSFVITDHTSVLDIPMGIPQCRGLIGMSILKYGTLHLDPVALRGAFLIHLDRFVSPIGSR